MINRCGAGSALDGAVSAVVSALSTSEVCFVSICQKASLALGVAQELARALGAPLTVIEIRPAPDTRNEDRSETTARRDMSPFVHRRRYVCRRAEDAISVAFRPHSLIVLPGKHSWLPTRAERLRRALESAGHFVLLVDDADTPDHRRR